MNLVGKIGWRPLSRAVTRRVIRLQTHQGRRKTGLFLIEGFRLLAAALDHDWPVETVIVRDDNSSRKRLAEILERHGGPRLSVYTAPPKTVTELTATVQPSGIIALARQKRPAGEDKKISGKRFLLADNLRNPGNLGAVLRCAAAFEIDGVYLSTGCVDLYNPKVVRAAMGALFCLPVYPDTDFSLFGKRLRRAGFTIWVADPHEGVAPRSARLPAKWVLVIGGETEGYSDIWQALKAKPIRIPMSGGVESLNSAVAAGIILFCLSSPPGRRTRGQSAGEGGNSRAGRKEV